MNMDRLTTFSSRIGHFWKKFLLLGCLSLLLSPLLQANLSSRAMETMEISGEPVTIVAEVEEPEELYQWLFAATEEEGKQRLFLILEGLEYDRPANLFHEVYLNLPANPNNQDIHLHYAGNMALYAFPQGANYQLEIFDQVQKLVRQGKLKNLDPFTVTFVPASLQGVTSFENAPKITFKRLIISR